MTQPAADASPASPPRRRFREIAALFVRLGFTAFGGPAAHTAMMEREAVSRRRWLDRQHFLDLVAAINFIPGPNSTQLAMQLGYLRGGIIGLVLAGFCFIIPAVLIILPLAWLYVTYGAKPDIRQALIGISACVVSIVATALLRFAKAGLRDRFTIVVAAVAAGLGFLCEPTVIKGMSGFAIAPHTGIGAVAAAIAKAAVALAAMLKETQPEIVILAAAAIAGAIWYGRSQATPSTAVILPLFALPTTSAAAVAPIVVSAEWWPMALFFLKIGATLFGSGYVLVSYLQSGLVDGYGWLTRQQLLDAVAVGQVTPGPLLTTATFIGFLLGHGRFGGGLTGGIAGAVLATAAIFLPSFIFVSLLGPLLPKIRANPFARGALNGMNAAVVALILVVTVRLGATALTDPLTWDIAAITLLAILRWDVNSTWLILAAAAAGIARHMIR